jgi:hypothetical protein
VVRLDKKLLGLCGISWFIGFVFIISNFIIPASSIWVADILRPIGIAILITSTVGVLFSTHFSSVFKTHLNEMIQRIQLAYLLATLGIPAVYPRLSEFADQELKNHLFTIEKGTIRLLGISLRVFFIERYDETINQIIMNENLKFEVLLLDPNSEQALIRAEIEEEKFYTDDKNYKVSNLFQEIHLSKSNIDRINEKFPGKNEEERIQFRFYPTSPYCTLILFDDACYVYQNIFNQWTSEKRTQLPLFKYFQGSEGYKKYREHFDYVWAHSYPWSYVEKSLTDQPIVQITKRKPEIETFHLDKKEGKQEFKLTITGRHFSPLSTVMLNNKVMETGIITEKEIIATLPEKDLMRDPDPSGKSEGLIKISTRFTDAWHSDEVKYKIEPLENGSVIMRKS